jgi:hypothetical protein
MARRLALANAPSSEKKFCSSNIDEHCLDNADKLPPDTILLQEPTEFGEMSPVLFLQARNQVQALQLAFLQFDKRVRGQTKTF